MKLKLNVWETLGTNAYAIYQRLCVYNYNFITSNLVEVEVRIVRIRDHTVSTHVRCGKLL
jgi:hypothetical protein